MNLPVSILSPSLVPDPGRLPAPGRPHEVEVGLQRWREAGARAADPAAAEFVHGAAGDPAGRALLEAIFGNSPFLSHALIADIGFARRLLGDGPAAVFPDCLAEMWRPPENGEDAGSLMRRMRRAKRRSALAAGVADITGAWALDQVTLALSSCAEATLQAACRHLLVSAAASGEIALANPADPERGSGLIVLGMGKLGAGELNYSSDIDLIVLYDHEVVDYRGKDGPQRCFVRLARNLVRMMEERTGDGYVFRTDLRLRPDPGATPLAVSTLAAETYYESAGQNWERAALIKARPVAGDVAAGHRFLLALRPFIWRRNLDFAAIQDIHSIKRQINAHRGGGGGAIAVAGHNVKLGRGGIREIEFFAQTQQLIWGGRDPALRVRGTCAALAALADTGHVKPEVARRLTEAYAFLRRLEHRLQMTQDQQTHRLPDSEADLAALAAFLGYPSLAAFADALLAELRAVEQHYARLFEEAPDLSGPGNLVFTGAEDDPETIETLKRLGYRDPAMVAATIRSWHHGRFRAMRSARARELLTELVPTILQELSEGTDPDGALLRFNEFLGALPAGVQLFSLFYANPGLLDLVAVIMGNAPRLAGWLSRHPILLDAVLSQGFFDPLPARDRLAADLDQRLGQARDFEDVLELIRRWNNDRTFQIGTQILRGRATPDAAGATITDVAEASLAALLPRVESEFAHAHGRLRRGGMAIVALGKLGGREMTIGSDLDLMLIYDGGDGEASDGARPLSPSHYFARLSQRVINAVTAPTGEGKLYEVDMRLRPSGQKGPIATPLDGFVQYQHKDAWTWEHMALTRARVICGPDELAGRIRAAVLDVLGLPRDPEKLRADVADMRLRMEREHRGDDPWEVKHYRGGLVDIEFIAQYLQLRHAHAHPEILAPNTTDALGRIARAGLIEGDAAAELIAATRLWRNLQGLLRLSLATRFDDETAPNGLRQLLVAAADATDFADLKVRMAATAATVRRHYAALVGEPTTAPAGGRAG
jgi:glutamate-ammonia-ligase adenylyltransferase